MIVTSLQQVENRYSDVTAEAVEASKGSGWPVAMNTTAQNSDADAAITAKNTRLIFSSHVRERTRTDGSGLEKTEYKQEFSLGILVKQHINYTIRRSILKAGSVTETFRYRSLCEY